MKTYRILLSCIVICMASLGGMQAQQLSAARIYINPGHGGWGSNDRPLATINYAALDTLGFFETNTNLLKGFALRDELLKAGANSSNIRMSRTKNGIAAGGASTGSKVPEVGESADQIVTLSAICTDVETRNMDYFISIHSNAATDGGSAQYPLLLYRGTDAAVGNHLTNAKNMAAAAWSYVNDNDITYHSSYASSSNVRGDITFMGSSATTTPVAGGKSYTGYYGVLRHGCDGYLSEGCFHTYHPERHRLLNKDYCRQEGVRYSRAIRAWFGNNTETKGCIMGTVKDATKALSHTWYQGAKGNDLYYPLNYATVILKNSGGTEVARYTTDKEYNGVFVFTELIPGAYTLTFNANNYTETTASITVTANKTAFINQRLQPTSTSNPDPDKQYANIYAYDLKIESGAVNHTTKQVTVSYKLNAPASSVTFSVDGCSVAPVSAGTAEGANTAVLALDNLPQAGGELDWSVTATGLANTPSTSAILAKVNSDTQFCYYHPRGIAVDNNPGSSYFGNIYIGEGGRNGLSLNLGSGTRTVQKGIYVLDPLMAGIKSTSNGGVSWLDSNTESPGKVSVAPDGKVWMSENTTTASTKSKVWIMDPGSPASFNQALTADRHGRIADCHVRGTGTDAKLYITDVVNATALTDPTIISEYNISSGIYPLSATPTQVVSNSGTIVNKVNTIYPGKGGGWWMSQACSGNGSTGRPAIVYMTKNGTTGTITYNAGATVLNASGVMTLSSDESLLAVAQGNMVDIYAVTYNSSNIPTGLTYKYQVNTGAAVHAVAFDYASNLYSVSYNSERLKVYALNKASNTLTTPARMKIVVLEDDGTAEEPIIGAYYIPKGSKSKGWNDLTTAFNEINQQGIAGDVELLITGDISSGNIGLINSSNHSITIKSDDEEEIQRKITLTGAAGTFSGAFVIGSKSAAWTDLVATKKITLDNLIIETTTTNNPITIVDACDDITIKNCNIRSTQAASRAIYLLYNNSYGQKKMPSNITFDGNTITNNSGTYVIEFYNTNDAVTPTGGRGTGIVIKNNKISGINRILWLNNITGTVNITGNEFHVVSGSGANAAGAILTYWNVSDATFNVSRNHFIELTTTNTAVNDVGVKGIFTVNATNNSTWNIDNNYFAGFDQKATAANSMLQGIRVSSATATVNIRHNTFYMPALSYKLTGNVAAPANSTTSMYCAISAPSGTYVIKNNLFVGEETAFPNFFVRGTAITAGDNNVFCVPSSQGSLFVVQGNAKPGDLRYVNDVDFADKATGNLDINASLDKDVILAVPRLEGVVTSDIYGKTRNALTYAGAFEWVEGTVGIRNTGVDGVRIICSDRHVSVVSDHLIKSVKLYDLQGRIIEFKQNVSDNNCLLIVPTKGIYIVETQTENGLNVQKAAVK